MRIPWWQSMEWRTYRLPSFVDWAECRHPMCVSMFRSFRGPKRSQSTSLVWQKRYRLAFFFTEDVPNFQQKQKKKKQKTVITRKEDSYPKFSLKNDMDFPPKNSRKLPGCCSSLVVNWSWAKILMLHAAVVWALLLDFGMEPQMRSLGCWRMAA